MADTVFRQPVKTQETKPEVMPERADSKSDLDTNSFLGYEAENKAPYLSKYFEVENIWSDPVGGFKEDFEYINKYLQNKINSGEMADTIQAVKDKVKWIEKMANIDKNERTVMKVEKTKAFVRFLNEVEEIKINGIKYGQ